MWYVTIHGKIIRTLVDSSAYRTGAEMERDRLISIMPELSSHLEVELFDETCPVCDLRKTDPKFAPFCGAEHEAFYELELQQEEASASREDEL